MTEADPKRRRAGRPTALLAALALGLAGLGLAACGDDNEPSPQERIEQGVEEATEGVEEGKEKAEEGFEQGREEAEEGIEKGREEAEKGIEKGKEEAEEFIP